MAQYQLYVFELSEAAARRRGISPRYSSKSYLYVGYTSRLRRIRLKEHREGRFSADRRWAPFYVRARADLYRLWPVYKTLDEALAGERQLAKALAIRGFTVVNKTGSSISITTSTPRRRKRA